MSGRGCHTAWATGSLGIGSSGSTRSISLSTNRKRSPRSARPTTMPGPASAVNTQAHRVLAAADAQRVDLDARHGRVVIDGHTSSMCAPSTFGSPGPKWYV